MFDDRQQVLQLWLSAAALDTTVIGWAFYDGTDGEAPGLPDERPPYATGVDALRDGWSLLQAPGPIDADRVLAEAGTEFVFTRTMRRS
ncbi:MAG: hypothetical protein R2710_20670 [Acidimicrobiales bacterium]